MIKVLFIGDVCGKPGRNAVKQLVPQLRKEHDIDLVITNAENVAHGRGVSVNAINELMSAGIDHMTSGNHVWKHPEFEEVLSGEYPIIRPINYPDDVMGKGYAEIDLGSKGIFLLVNVMGVAFFNERTLSEPFRRLNSLFSELDMEKYSGSLIDFHAESTSEKLSAGLYYDGQISTIVGTHTHIPTADERIFPKGTAYITDVGMTGPDDSSLWVKKEAIFRQNMYPYPVHYEMQEEGPVRFDSVLIEIESDKKAVSIRRINKIL